MPEEPKSQRSVLAILGERIGLAPKVRLSDLASDHGASPLVDPGSSASRLVPQGRGNYQLLGEIARGGMGVILKGHDTDLGRDVAVKVLDGDLAKRPEVVQRFVEEAQIGGQLQHPGIVPVYELGLMADERPYFTMKLVKGRTLAALFQQRKSPADNRGRLLAIFESVCQTMAYAHSKSVLHRDLKPANVMVGAFGEVQVVDWGLAKVLRRGGVADEKRAKESLHTVIETVRSGSGSSGSDSMVGSVMGTPAYMAPEQAQGEVDQLDARADVFSLGAILCELLTGRPPYEERAGETILTQASHAKLQPARERIEACEADPQLVQLCLQCLMPARTARPANAAEVANAVHQYLASVEERAQKAELAAEKSRIKAAEERRARRLTMALAGTILVALLGGGGGLWWIQHERERRAVHTRAAVDAAHGESSELARAGEPEQALAAARRALSLAENGDADAALLERARSFVAAAELELSAAERERTLRAQDDALRERLIDLRLRQIAANHNHPREIELDADFARAFREYGVELEGDDLVPALTRIRERKLAGEVALVLDDWGRLRRHVRGDTSKESENLFLLAMDLDPDPERLRMREAIAAHDRSVMLELTSTENLPKLQPGSISILCAELWGDGSPDRQPDVYRILEQALQLYPGDFLLQAFAGSFYQQGQRFESALVCRAAAMSLRPGDLTTRADVAESMWSLGRLTDAQSTLRTCVTADPSNAVAWQLLSAVQIALGDYSGALASVTDKPGIESDPELRVSLYIAQYYAGIRVREQLERDLANEPISYNVAAYLLALTDHADPKQRDPALVVRTLESRAAAFPGERWQSAIEAIARARLEDWDGALSVIERDEPRSSVMVLTPMAREFLCALIYSRAGRPAEARAWYAHGVAEWNERTALDPAAWERSDAMRWRREADVAMAR